MHSTEPKVSNHSNYYIYAPSTLAKKIYLYPICLGYFYYEPNYHISRNSFDSYLLMCITRGSCSICIEGTTFTANAGQAVLLNCYRPHQYGSTDAWEAAWLHFDGQLANTYYQEIITKHGPILSPSIAQGVFQNLQKIYSIFHGAYSIEEPKLSKYITHMLDELLIFKYETVKKQQNSHLIADSVTFINDHFHAPISLELLAKQAHLSLFHFSRLFAKETGYTPHQYILLTRIAAAKYLLQSPDISIKDIAFSTGFNSESSFCTTFKKWEMETPSNYRTRILT